LPQLCNKCTKLYIADESPLGLIRVLTFKAYLLAGLSVSCFALAGSWLMGISGKKGATTALIFTGASQLAASLLTEAIEEPDTKQHYRFI
jgi:hypothetical protein